MKFITIRLLASLGFFFILVFTTFSLSAADNNKSISFDELNRLEQLYLEKSKEALLIKIRSKHPEIPEKEMQFLALYGARCARAGTMEFLAKDRIVLFSLTELHGIDEGRHQFELYAQRRVEMFRVPERVEGGKQWKETIDDLLSTPKLNAELAAEISRLCFTGIKSVLSQGKQ